MFETQVGAVADSASVAYLRPETAQAMFVQFKNVATSMRRKLPFGIAQIGKAFRNEITPRNFIFRLREFEQMEMEFFVHPRDEDEWFAHWVDARHRWWTDVLGIAPTACACARTTPMSCATTPSRPPTSSTSSRSAGPSSRASPTAPTSTSRRTPPAAASGSRSSTRRPASTSCRT